MFMTPQIRRVAVMLARIPKFAEVRFVNHVTNHQYFTRFVSLEEENNVARFQTETNSPVSTIPLDCIVSVYEGWSSE